jgi:hypothetical protein
MEQVGVGKTLLKADSHGERIPAVQDPGHLARTLHGAHTDERLQAQEDLLPQIEDFLDEETGAVLGKVDQG